MIGILEIIIRLVLIVATSVLFGILFLTYLRFRNRKMLLISTGFGILYFTRF